MTYHENPADIPVGSTVSITYTATGNTYSGVVTEPGILRDSSGRHRNFGDKEGNLRNIVNLLGDAEVDLTAQQKRDRDHAEIALADFKRETSDLLVQIGHDYGIDEDAIDDMHDRLGIDRPKAEPIDVEVTVKVTARLTPTSRRAARDVEHGSFLADSVVGLDLIDFDADAFEVDLHRGINVEVDDWNVTN